MAFPTRAEEAGATGLSQHIREAGAKRLAQLVSETGLSQRETSSGRRGWGPLNGDEGQVRKMAAGSSPSPTLQLPRPGDQPSDLILPQAAPAHHPQISKYSPCTVCTPRPGVRETDTPPLPSAHIHPRPRGWHDQGPGAEEQHRAGKHGGGGSGGPGDFMEEVDFLVATFKIRSAHTVFFQKENKATESSHLLSTLPGTRGTTHITYDPHIRLEDSSRLGGSRGQSLHDSPKLIQKRAERRFTLGFISSRSCVLPDPVFLWVGLS